MSDFVAVGLVYYADDKRVFRRIMATEDDYHPNAPEWIAKWVTSNTDPARIVCVIWRPPEHPESQAPLIGTP